MEDFFIYYALGVIIGFLILWFIIYSSVKHAIKDSNNKNEEIIKHLNNIFIQLGGNKFKYDEIDKDVISEIEEKYKEHRKINAYNIPFYPENIRKKMEYEIEIEKINRKSTSSIL